MGFGSCRFEGELEKNRISFKNKISIEEQKGMEFR